MAKEHETEFHDNPTYVTAFVLHHVQIAVQLHEVEMSSPPSNKRKTQPTLPSPCVTGYSQFHIWLQVTRFYFPYMETDQQLIWIVMAPGRQCKSHAPSAAHKLLILE